MVTRASILAINGGSSSIKFAVFETATALTPIFDGRIEGIGVAAATLTVRDENAGVRQVRHFPELDYPRAVDVLLDGLSGHLEAGSLSAVGHRVVHGGPDHCEAERLTPALIEDLRQKVAFDPVHLPAALLLIDAVGCRFPTLPQVACFDTGFHHDLPRVASILPIPRRFDVKGIRRYGFHGLSYAYLMQELERLAGSAVANGRTVLAHLGNGASLAAVRNHRSVDTTMAFTSSAGVPMGSRSGDLDPGLFAFLAQSEQMSASQFDRMVNHESGLLGISETSADVRELLLRERTDVRAAEAIALFCYHIKKNIGAYAAVLGGLDTLVFSGGIGENSAVVRTRICEGLSFLGVELDVVRNTEHAAVISTDAGRVAVRVIGTDEQRVIAKSVSQVLGFRP